MLKGRKDKEMTVKELENFIGDAGDGTMKLSCLAVLAWNIKQQREVFRWIKRQSLVVGVGFALVSFAILGVLIYLMINADSQTLHTPAILLAILTEAVLAGIFLLLKRGIFQQTDKYRTNLHEDGQFWMMVGLATGIKEETDLYECIIESEIRRREKISKTGGEHV